MSTRKGSKKITMTQEVSSKQAAGAAVVNKYIPWAMGVGFIPAPVLISAGLVGIQVKMVHDIAKVYGVSLSEHRAKHIVLSLLGGIAPTALGAGGLGGLVAAIPFVGPFLMPATIPLLAGASTYAVGKTFVSHFESGGSFLDFDVDGAKELFAERYHEGKEHASKVASNFNDKLSKAVAI